MSKILAIDSSKGMVALYNATLGRNRECAMGAVQGDFVAGVLVERGEAEGDGMLGVPKGLGQGWSLLGLCVRCQFSMFRFYVTLKWMLTECFSLASTSSAHTLTQNTARISSSALSKSSSTPWRTMVFFSLLTSRKSLTPCAHGLARRLTGRNSCAAVRKLEGTGVKRLRMRV